MIATFSQTATDYSMGYTDAFLELLNRRSACHNAAHLIPHLAPQSHILDLGSGPGNITRQLAQLLPRGHATGLDYNPDQVAYARHMADTLRVPNLTYVKADATLIPFPDNHFDAVHCHAFLMHTPCVRTVLTEAYRVLRPGGIISSRDMDVPASYISPSSPTGPTIFDMLSSLIRHTGGTPTISRHLKTFFMNAGFQPVSAGASSDFFDSPEDISFLARFLTAWALSPSMEQDVTERGIATNWHFASWRTQLARWSQRPSAVGSFAFAHAIGRKPL